MMYKGMTLGELSQIRGEIIRELDDDMYSDEDHPWRAQKYQCLVAIETKIHELQK